ncbi:MAG: hypothetical protein HFE76_04475 [Firmicutes bacterium]|nr:hypothetical protein [Bacillota bacterium]
MTECKSYTGMNAITIFNKLKELAILTGIHISSEDLLTYDRLNQEIETYMG